VFFLLKEILKFDYADEEDENLDLDSKREAKKGIREKINDLQEIGFKVQEALDYVASLGEKIIK
jgi:DNA-binding transcriptional regulator YhcF (GntR family)